VWVVVMIVAPLLVSASSWVGVSAGAAIILLAVAVTFRLSTKIINILRGV